MGTGAEFTLPQKSLVLSMILSFSTWYSISSTAVFNFLINHSNCKEIEVFYSWRKGAKRVRVKGMDKFLEVQAEPSDGDDPNGDDNVNDNTDVGDARVTTRGDDAPVRSPSLKCRRTSRGEPTRKK